MTKTTASQQMPRSHNQIPPPALHTQSLGFRWQPDQPLLRFPDIALNAGEHLFLRGASGSGKSTLLGLLAGLNRASTGTTHLLGLATHHFAPSERDLFRADHIGVIFQQFNLVPYLTALANVALPCQLSRVRRERVARRATLADIHAHAAQLLTTLAIPQALHDRKPAQLSIGQQQRIAAARALIGAPELILADEPTSALDGSNRDRFLQLLLDLAERHGISVVFASHDNALARHFDQQLELEAQT